MFKANSAGFTSHLFFSYGNAILELKGRIKRSLQNGAGFTLIEILVACSIVVIVFTIGIAAYNRFNQNQVLNQARLDLKNNLRLAQEKAISGVKDCTGYLVGYEFTFNEFDYSWRSVCSSAGTNYGSPTAVSLTEKKISFPSLPSPNPILFKVLGRGTNIEADSTIVLSGFGKTQTIVVKKSGEIN